LVFVSPSEYFRNLFEWILKDNFGSETKFPFFSKEDAFPDNFRAIVADIARRLFRYFPILSFVHLLFLIFVFYFLSYLFSLPLLSVLMPRVYAHLYHHHYTEIVDDAVIPLEIYEKSFELYGLICVIACIHSLT
jgi:hypothetical protein